MFQKFYRADVCDLLAYLGVRSDNKFEGRSFTVSQFNSRFVVETLSVFYRLEEEQTLDHFSQVFLFQFFKAFIA